MTQLRVDRIGIRVVPPLKLQGIYFSTRAVSRFFSSAKWHVMGRPRKPTSALEFKGSFKKDPQRKKRRASEPVVAEPIGNAPAHLNEDQKKAWRDIKKSAPNSALTKADGLFLEVVAGTLAQYRLTGNLDYAKELRMQFGRLGMTPSDRSKVDVPVVPKANKFDDNW